jgi:hypothetical protein
MAHDQTAREALVSAVQQQAGPDGDRLRPDPAYRAEVLRRLSPHPVWAWLRQTFARPRTRTIWSLAATAFVLFLLVNSWPIVTPALPAGPGLAESAAPILSGQENSQPVCPAPPVICPTSRWPMRDHLVKAHEEEATRKNKRSGLHPAFPPESPMVP